MELYFKRTLLIVSFIFICLLFPGSSQTSTWTVQTLKEYVDQRFEAVTEAVTKAEDATEKRFASVNEFRNTLSDQQRTFIPRAEYEAGHISLSNEVSELKARIAKIESMKQGGSITLYIIIAVISSLVAFMALSKNFIASIYQKNKERS